MAHRQLFVTNEIGTPDQLEPQITNLEKCKINKLKHVERTI